MRDRMEALGAVDPILPWLANGQFVFLGAVDYDREPDGSLRLRAGSELGLARDNPRVENPPPMPGDGAVVIARTSDTSKVFRSDRQTVVTVRPDERTESRFVGLLSTNAYRVSVLDIPGIGQELRRALDLTEARMHSHAGRATRNVLENLPRDLVLEQDVTSLAQLVDDIVGLQERQLVRVFEVPELVGPWVTVLCYLPRSRFTADLPERIADVVAEAYGASERTFEVFLAASSLARITVSVRRPDHHTTADPDALERVIDDLSTSWEDRLREALVAEVGEAQGREQFERIGAHAPPAYRAAVLPGRATGDVRRIAALLDGGDPMATAVGHDIDAPDREWRFRIYRRGEPASLSELLPLLDHLGLEALDEQSHTFRSGDERVFLYDIGVRVPTRVEVDGQRWSDLQRAFTALVLGDVEGDGFNRLVLAAGLTAREVAVVRAYGKYLRQIGFSFSQPYIEATLQSHPRVVADLIALFHARFDPARSGGDERDRIVAEIRDRVCAALDAIPSLDDDRICRMFLTLIDATVRTNYYRHRLAISFKFDPDGDPRAAAAAPPLRDLGVRAAGRGGPSARRPDRSRRPALERPARGLPHGDPRTDEGADGQERGHRADGCQGRLRGEAAADGPRGPARRGRPVLSGVHQQSVGPDRQPRRRRRSCIRRTRSSTTATTPISSSLPTRERRRSATSPTRSRRSTATGWATRSPPEAAPDTTTRRWASRLEVRGRACADMPACSARTPTWIRSRPSGSATCQATCSATGCSARELCASSPRSTTATSSSTRVRTRRSATPSAGACSSCPRSSWADYNADLISAGGGVYSRTLKSIVLSPEARAALGAPDRPFTPNELVSVVLQAPVDLLWNGGIGTYVKSRGETNSDVGDRANDAVRVDGADLRVRMVAEGGNLGLTQLGRVEYALRGGLIHTDAIDNSAGVDCSDHEVNIKVLLDGVVAEGELTGKQRDELLASMTGDVAQLVLDNNKAQTLALLIARRQALPMVNVHARYIDVLENDGWLDRGLEFLPSDKQLAERQSSGGQGLQAPEFAVLIAYTKNANVAEMVRSDLPDAKLLEADLIAYFPPKLRERYGDEIRRHPLRREIIATRVVNQMVNQSGISFDHRMTEDTGASVVDVTRAWVAARQIFDYDRLWTAIDALPRDVPLDVQLELFLDARRMVERGVLWLLRHRRPPLDMSANVEQFRPGIERLATRLGPVLVGRMADAVQSGEASRLTAGVPEDLAERAGVWTLLHTGFDVVEVAQSHGRDVAEVAAVEWQMFDRLGLYWLWDGIGTLPRSDRWQTQARSALRDDLLTALAELTATVIESADGNIERWLEANERSVARAGAMFTEIRRAESFDLTTLSVALRQLRNLSLTAFAG